MPAPITSRYSHPTAGEGEPEHPLWEAALQVVEATQQLILQRLDLMRYELREDLNHLVVGALMMLMGGLLMLAAWLGCCLALVLALHPRLDPALTVGLLSLLHLAAAFALVRRGNLQLSESHDD